VSAALQNLRLQEHPADHRPVSSPPPGLDVSFVINKYKRRRNSIRQRDVRKLRVSYSCVRILAHPPPNEHLPRLHDASPPRLRCILQRSCGSASLRAARLASVPALLLQNGYIRCAHPDFWAEHVQNPRERAYIPMQRYPAHVYRSRAGLPSSLVHVNTRCGPQHCTVLSPTSEAPNASALQVRPALRRIGAGSRFSATLGVISVSASSACDSKN
jgi:hypothetical protein